MTRFGLIAWDVDGTLLDSVPCGWTVAELVLEVATGRRPRIRTADDERRLFGPEALDAAASGRGDTLRLMHRIGMQARAAEIRLIPGVEAVVRAVEVPQIVVTAALANYARAGLGEIAEHFAAILGFEEGTKPDLLRRIDRRANPVYVGDCIRDVEIAREVGIPMVAVSWGLNSAQELRAVGPDFVVESAQELARVLLED